MKSKFIIKCPRCSKSGRLRIKDKRYNMVEVSHYDSEKYQKGKGGGSKPHYIGTIRNPQKLIDQVFEKYGVNYTEENKKEFSNIIQKFSKAVKEDKETDITQNEITIMTSILNELRKIRKAKEIKSKIGEIKKQWRPTCPKCHNEISVWATFKGVQIKHDIILSH